MKHETRAQRGLRRVPNDVVLAVDTYGNTPAHALRQDLIARRFGLSPLHAALIAELAFTTPDSWRGRL